MKTTKRCTRCKVEKPTAEFSRSGERLQSWCRPCHREWDRDHYRSKPGRKRQVTQAKRRWEKREVERIRQFLADHLAGHPCVDCGETDPVVLEFDHVRGEKIAEVSKLARSSVARVAAEVAKCDVRCGNCHRRKTARERNWWIWRAAQALENGTTWS